MCMLVLVLLNKIHAWTSPINTLQVNNVVHKHLLIAFELETISSTNPIYIKNKLDTHLSVLVLYIWTFSELSRCVSIVYYPYMYNRLA